MANSFKQMCKKGGPISRRDSGMFISLDDIHIQDGFNKRIDDERTRQADEELFQFLLSGGTVPPLEVRPRDEGGVWVVEGAPPYSSISPGKRGWQTHQTDRHCPLHG